MPVLDSLHCIGCIAMLPVFVQPLVSSVYSSLWVVVFALTLQQCCDVHTWRVQDTALQQHTERLQSALDMARRLQQNEETTLKDRMEMVSKRLTSLYVCLYVCVHERSIRLSLRC